MALEEKLLVQSQYKPWLWWRYIDDVFLVEDCVNIEINSLRIHVAESDEYLLVAVKNEQLLGEGKEKATIQFHFIP